MDAEAIEGSGGGAETPPKAVEAADGFAEISETVPPAR
jgi:hypothetical protein